MNRIMDGRGFPTSHGDGRRITTAGGSFTAEPGGGGRGRWLLIPDITRCGLRHTFRSSDWRGRLGRQLRIRIWGLGTSGMAAGRTRRLVPPVVWRMGWKVFGGRDWRVWAVPRRLFAPWAGRFSNFGEALRNDRVRAGLSSMGGSEFGRGAVSMHQNHISEGDLRGASGMTGRMPVTVSRESFQATNRAAAASTIRTGSPSSQRFFSNSGSGFADRIGCGRRLAQWRSQFESWKRRLGAGRLAQFQWRLPGEPFILAE